MKIRHFLMIAAAGSLCVRTATGAMSVRVDATAQHYTILEDDRPVLTYSFGTNPVPAGVKGIYAVARGDYVHPLYGPSGEVLTMDFSPDHPHHRGLYWAWPEVTFNGETADLHALQGVFARPQRILDSRADAQTAELVAQNAWLWKDKEPIVIETATITVHRASAGLQSIDFALRFDPLKPGVTLARRHKDQYGGFNCRLSARTGQQIEKSAPGWAELRGTPPGGKETIGILILQSPSNPDYPGDWVDYPNLNWLQPTFPAKGTTYALTPGATLELRFRIIVRSGAGLAANPSSLFEAYAASCPDPLLDMVRYTSTQSRSALAIIEDQCRKATAVECRTLEQRLLRALAQSDASGDFKRWACKQLVLVGSDAAIPTAARLLSDDTAWMQAADVLYSRPGDEGLNALRKAIPDLPAERQVALIHVLAMRSRHEDSSCDAPLQAAEAAAAAGRKDEACALYKRLMNDPAAPAWQRGAALRGLAAMKSTESVALVTQALADGDRHIRNGAIAALSTLPDAALSSLRTSWTGCTDRTKLALIRVWGERGIRDAEPELLGALSSTNTDLSMASIRALRTAGSVRSVGPLLALSTTTDETGKEAKATLAQMRADGVDAEMRTRLHDTNATVAAAALSLLGARQAAGYLDDMVAGLTDGRRELARSASGVLRTDGGKDQLPPLRRILLSANSDSVRDDVARVMVSICKRQSDTNGALDSVLSGTPPLDGPARKAMLSALPAMGGSAALAFAGRVHDEAAARALLNWPDASALDPLLEMARKPGNDAGLRALAASGYAQLAQRVLPADRQAAALIRILPYVVDAAEKSRLGALIANVNLALHAPVTASCANEEGRLPERAVDGDRTINSYWAASPPPANLTVDLCATQRIDRIRMITWWDGTRYYQYNLDVSTDGARWNRVVDMSKNTVPASADGMAHHFAPVNARYVRATMLHNSANIGLHVVELEVYAAPATETAP